MLFQSPAHENGKRRCSIINMPIIIHNPRPDSTNDFSIHLRNKAVVIFLPKVRNINLQLRLSDNRLGRCFYPIRNKNCFIQKFIQYRIFFLSDFSNLIFKCFSKIFIHKCVQLWYDVFGTLLCTLLYRNESTKKRKKECSYDR